MKKETQKNWVIGCLLVDGKVNNLQAIKKGVWRLSDIIFKLRNEGHDISGDFIIKKGVRTKIYEYTLN